MASTQGESFDELREGILQGIKEKYDKSLKEQIQLFSSSGNPLPPSVIADVTAKFQQTFSSYLATGFDIVFGNELLSSVSANDEKEKYQDNSTSSDQHNLSVTNEQLQEMDNGMTKVARRRKEYPKKCTKLLERTLEYQAKAAEKIRVNVNNVEPLDETGGLEIESNHELQENMEELQSSVRKQIQKSVRIESSLQMLGETMSTE